MPKKDIPSLRDVLKDDFFIGAAVTSDQVQDIHKELLTKHFNMIVAENATKPEHVEPEPGHFTWDEADQIIDFAVKNNMKARFHTLVWHNQTPDWFFQDGNGNEMTPTPENKKILLARLEDYITTVVNRYKDRIDYWDVVNEVIDPDEPDGMRKSKWFQMTGIDYIKVAFQTVRRVAGPDAKLYINDYNSMRSKKRRFLYTLVERLLEQDVPIDGVGHQMHVGIKAPPTPDTVAETVDMFADLGLDNQVTEMDVSLYTNSEDKYSTISEQLFIKQGHRFKELFEVFRQKSDKISAVVTWGISDNHTWKKDFPISRLDLPLIFDESHQAKYAYWGIVDSSKLPPVDSK